MTEAGARDGVSCPRARALTTSVLSQKQNFKFTGGGLCKEKPENKENLLGVLTFFDVSPQYSY